MIKRFLCLLIFLFPIYNRIGADAPPQGIEMQHKEPHVAQFDLYTALNLSDKGLAFEAFQYAIKGHTALNIDCKLMNSTILTIADFSQSSRKKRLYVIDLQNKVVLFNTLVAHGRNTGEEYATHFSNVSGSFESSLGFYVTKEKAWGSTVGLSLILEGMEKGINDNALQREIIMHGADYATENFIHKTGRLGRSYGCPSLPPDLIKPVVETIKEGTCLFIYYPDADYISHSGLINQP